MRYVVAAMILVASVGLAETVIEEAMQVKVVEVEEVLGLTVTKIWYATEVATSGRLSTADFTIYAQNAIYVDPSLEYNRAFEQRVNHLKESADSIKLKIENETGVLYDGPWVNDPDTCVISTDITRFIWEGPYDWNVLDSFWIGTDTLGLLNLIGDSLMGNNWRQMDTDTLCIDSLLWY